MSISIVIPAKNEAPALKLLLPQLAAAYPNAEILLIDDGSEDDTAAVAAPYVTRVIRHPVSLGNGAAIKTGARAATAEVLVFMDGDNQHKPESIAPLLSKLDEGYAMAVGARTQRSHASMGRLLANQLYNRLASWVVNHPVQDLTSGLRAVKRSLFLQFLHLLPNSFSYPSTCTMAFFKSGYPVCYVPITTNTRIGVSHIRPFKDGCRFFLIIYKIAILYSPLKLFLPIALLHFMLGMGRWGYTYYLSGRFTNMSAVLLTTAVMIFLIGLVAEQITLLSYQPKSHDT